MQSFAVAVLFAVAVATVAGARNNNNQQSQYCQDQCREQFNGQEEQMQNCQRMCNQCYKRECFTGARAQQYNCQQEPTGKQCQSCAQDCFQQFQNNKNGNQMEQMNQQMPSVCFQKCEQNNKEFPGFCQANCFRCFNDECFQQQCQNQANNANSECQECANKCAKQFYGATTANQMPYCQFQCQQNTQGRAAFQRCNQQCNACYNETCAKCGPNQQQECQPCADNCAKKFYGNNQQ